MRGSKPGREIEDGKRGPRRRAETNLGILGGLGERIDAFYLREKLGDQRCHEAIAAAESIVTTRHQGGKR